MGHTKYPTILFVIKVALTLAHGISKVERRFSDSGKTVTVDRTRLSKASINSVWITTGGLKVLGNLPLHVPITSLFIELGNELDPKILDFGFTLGSKSNMAFWHPQDLYFHEFYTPFCVSVAFDQKSWTL